MTKFGEEEEEIDRKTLNVLLIVIQLLAQSMRSIKYIPYINSKEIDYF